MKLIDLHKKWMETGELNSLGLCYSLPKEYKETFKLFTPSVDNFDELEKQNLSCGCAPLITFWASDITYADNTNFQRDYSYGPTRQSIVLLICAMHGEL